MTVYLIGHIEITDPALYRDYEAGFMDALTPHKGSILAVDDDPTTVEGETKKGRVVILSFPTRKHLDDWYGSDTSKTIMAFRHKAANSQIVSVRGFELPGW